MSKRPFARAKEIAAELGDAIIASPLRRAPDFIRYRRSRAPQPARMIAYDFETTSIKAGTPEPLYITAYAEHVMHYASSIDGGENLQQILINHFLTEEHKGAKFVAWAGNNYDAYFIATCLVLNPNYVLRPYLTRSSALRGLRVLPACDANKKNAKGWEFLDGMAMLGLVGVSLEKFLKNFAPEFGKMVGVIDFEKEQFDPTNPKHCEYAMRDSVGLYHGMQRAQQILIENFDQPLTVTMGGACIKILQAHMPADITVNTPRDVVLKLTRDYVLRGGYCYCARRYQGPVWKYDLNQAYAAAMREAKLPCGFTTHSSGEPQDASAVYIACVSASKSDNQIPFYYRTEVDGKMRSAFAKCEIHETWLTSIEIEQLRSEGWTINFLECYTWDNSFNLSEYVDKLETGRTRAEGGPSGPIGTVYKNVGNHSYGKTLEQLEPIEYLFSSECPPGYAPFYGNELEPVRHVYFRFVEDQRPKAYHQPQLGAFITAYVRMVVRRAALLSPDTWLYADTDCVVFASDVTSQLDIDPKRYGAWKVEEAGTVYQIIAKKVYAQVGGESPKRSAKGLNVKKLTPQDFSEWYDGNPPEQSQVQRQNFMKVMQGAEMFRSQKRRGTAVEAVTSPQGRAKSKRVSSPVT